MSSLQLSNFLLSREYTENAKHNLKVLTKHGADAVLEKRNIADINDKFEYWWYWL